MKLPAWRGWAPAFAAGWLYLAGLGWLNAAEWAWQVEAGRVLWLAAALLALALGRGGQWLPLLAAGLLWPLLAALGGLPPFWGRLAAGVSLAACAGWAAWLASWPGWGGWRAWALRLALGLGFGLATAAALELESNFAEEEFFALLTALALAGWWVLMSYLTPWPPSLKGRGDSPPPFREGAGGRFFWPVFLLAALGFGLFVVGAYQRSFYPALVAPAYPGISAESPFLCAEVPAESQTYTTAGVQQALLDLVRRRENLAAPEYGLLALAQGDEATAQTFRRALLDEAEAGLFTGPANSIKSRQHEAALRVYFYIELRQARPDLFTPAEQARLLSWFQAINRRAQTVEWVDWLYALALAQPPQGPYANQENGAGLLALLEAGGLAEPKLQAANSAYLAQLQGGWQSRFRNTDDAYIYQVDWLENAFFQAGLVGGADSQRQRLSFEWLLLQALPDGAPLRYNHVGGAGLHGVAYWAAGLLDDPRYLWLAGRTAEYYRQAGRSLPAQIELHQPLMLTGLAPTAGSCLLYGDSGMPNQVGPLAPDKVVLRAGWAADDLYLLLNLRFSGWHRYKATNALMLLYQGGPLVQEKLEAQTFAWLPEGRSLFRDKRIPRQNLNALTVGRGGLGGAVAALTGLGGPWAQDPPAYAGVERFEAGPEYSLSLTTLADWHGWSQRRWVYFAPDGLVVVLDEADGPAGEPAALFWHFAEDLQPLGGGRFALRAEPQAQAVFLPLTGALQVDGAQAQVLGRGKLRAAAVFLSGEWLGAEAEWLPDGRLRVWLAGREVVVGGDSR